MLHDLFKGWCESLGFAPQTPTAWRLVKLAFQRGKQEAANRITAQTFHEVYERMAPSFGYETRKDSAVPWEKVPEKNKKLMEAVAAEVRRLALR